MEFRSDLRVTPIQVMGDDRAIVAAARVSTQGPVSQEEFERDPEEARGLINFLMKNRHGTPFEHASMTFLVQAPIFVFREWHRHRIGWSYNEESGRYKQLEPVFYIPHKDRNLVQQGKPGHYEFVPGTEAQYSALVRDMTHDCTEAYASYQRKLDEGIAREVARMTLPVNIYSSMYATCNPRSLMAFLSLRTTDQAAMFPSFPMREIELAAKKMEITLEERFPITYETYCANGRVCP